MRNTEQKFGACEENVCLMLVYVRNACGQLSMRSAMYMLRLYIGIILRSLTRYKCFLDTHQNATLESLIDGYSVRLLAVAIPMIPDFQGSRFLRVEG